MTDFEQLANAIDLRGKDVVDIGCGDGAFVRALARAGADALGIEVSEDAVARARARTPTTATCSAARRSSRSRTQSVDVATLMLSLHHVPDPRSAFPELKRVVREHVFIAEPLPEGDFFELLRPVDDETEVRAERPARDRERRRLRAASRPSSTTSTLPIASFEALRDRVLAADPERAERFAELEADLRRPLHARRLHDPDARGPAAERRPVSTSRRSATRCLTASSPTA